MEAQLAEQVPLDVAQLLQEAVALLWGAEDKHLHLGELVQAVQALAGSPCPCRTRISRLICYFEDQEADTCRLLHSEPVETAPGTWGLRRQLASPHRRPDLPAAPASVRKQWPKPASLTGSWSSVSVWSMYIAPRGTSAVPVRHSVESWTAYTCKPGRR